MARAGTLAAMLAATALLYVGLGGCAILAVALVMQYDLHRRESWQTMMLGILAGAAGMFLCMWGQEACVRAHLDSLDTTVVWRWAVLAGVSEEATKFLVVVGMALACRDFDEPLDGLVYGSLVGLGAALTESIHMLGAPSQFTTLPREEPVRLLGHLVMGGIGGFGVGLMATLSWRYITTAIACFVAAVSLHVTWDVVAYHMADAAEPGQPPPYQSSGLAIGIMLGGFLFFRMLVSLCPVPLHAPGTPAGGAPAGSGPPA